MAEVKKEQAENDRHFDDFITRYILQSELEYPTYEALYSEFIVLKSRYVYLNHEIGNKNISFGKITVHFHAPYRIIFWCAIP